MNYKKNIHDLINDSHKFQYYEIGENNNDKNKPKYFFTKYQWIIILIVIVFLLYPSSGFPENFSGYVISGLSIFVGLLFTFLLTLYSKFKEINFNEIIKSNDRLLKNRMLVLKNYLKKISILSLYTILLSIICIILLSFSLIITQLNLYIDIRELTVNFKSVDLGLTLKSIIICELRVKNRF